MFQCVTLNIFFFSLIVYNNLKYLIKIFHPNLIELLEDKILALFLIHITNKV